MRVLGLGTGERQRQDVVEASLSRQGRPLTTCVAQLSHRFPADYVFFAANESGRVVRVFRWRPGFYFLHSAVRSTPIIRPRVA